ncbi:MAG: hypothetical protein R2778_07735 [Saprospiraceae bacterium]
MAITTIRPILALLSLGDYNQTTNPDHEQAQFPTDCVLCHTETAWVPSTFDHNAIYPFTGAHSDRG